jgi:5'-3' exonuclease
VPGQLTLLDAPSLWYRAFHGVPETVTAPDGTPVNAVRGTVDLIARIVKDTRPARLVAALDLDWRPAFRVAAVPSYKAHRLTANGAEAEPESLAPQVAVLLEVLDAVGLAVAGAEGHEADDVLGTLAARETGAVDVVTGDRDLFQLVRDDGPVRVLYAVEKLKPYGEREVAAKYGIPGTGYAEYAVLRGDPSDGLPGVSGVGAKTAAALINEFGDLAGIRAAVARTVVPRPPLTAAVLKKMHAAGDYLDAAPVVVAVACDIDLPPIEGALPRTPVDPEALAALATAHGLESALGRLGAALGWPKDALG